MTHQPQKARLRRADEFLLWSLIERAKSTGNNRVTKLIESSIPSVIPRSMSGPSLGKAIIDIHAALKSLMEAMPRPCCTTTKLFEQLDEAIMMAVSYFLSDMQSKQLSCFPSLTPAQCNRKYLQDGFLPSDEAHQLWIGCNHAFVDEPNTNKGLEAKYAKELAEFNRKKEEAKQNDSNKCIAAPEMSMPYRQHHCLQIYCVNVQSAIGNSCPIKYKKDDGTFWGIKDNGSCACPICLCKCNLAFGYNTGQIVVGGCYHGG
jgi:hypothetical protein